jgi:hypothetical protein
MTGNTDEQKRCMRDLTVAEHVRRARSELRGLDEHLAKGNRSDDPMFGTVTAAFVGSVGASLAMLDIKLREMSKELDFPLA